MRLPSLSHRSTVRAGAQTRQVDASASLLLLVALIGCSGSADPSKQLDTVASWTATARLAVAEHRAGAITSTYALQLDQEAADALTEARRQLPLSAHDTLTARRAAAAIDSLARTIRALDAEARR